MTCPIELIKIRQQNVLDRQLTAREVALDIFRRRGIKGLYRGITATALRDSGYGAYFATVSPYRRLKVYNFPSSHRQYLKYEATCRYFMSLSSPVRRSSQTHIGDHSSLIEEVEGDRGRLAWPALLFAGALAGVMGWLSTFAFDVVKTRVQSVDHNAAILGREGLEFSSSTKLSPPPGSPSIKRKAVSVSDSIGHGRARALAGRQHPFNSTISTIMHSYRTEGLPVFVRGLSPTLIRAVPVNMATFGVFEAVVHLLS